MREIHYKTVFTSFNKHTLVYSFKHDKRIGFLNNKDADYAQHCVARRIRRRNKKYNRQEWISPVCSESYNNEQLIPQDCL